MLRCSYCGSSRLRGSRLRLSDLPRLLILRLTVRCRVCSERAYASLWKVGLWKKKVSRAGEKGEEAMIAESTDDVVWDGPPCQHSRVSGGPIKIANGYQHYYCPECG